MRLLECFNGALEMDASGAFDEDDIPGFHIADKPLAGGFGVGKKDGSDAAEAGCGREMLCVSAHADDEVDAGIRGRFAGCCVKHGCVLAKLEHFSCNEDAAAAGAPARVWIIERRASGLEL